MTTKDRLIEIIMNGCKPLISPTQAGRAADALLANGVIVPPCMIGQTMWAIRDYKGIKQPQKGIVSDMYFTKDMSLHIVVKFVARGEFGKTVFLTEEEAQAALAAKNNK